MEHLSGSSVAAAALSSARGGSGAPVVLSDSLSAALAPDVEYHLREVVQDAAKFMRRAKRDTLRAEDVNAALRARRCPELLGYAGSGGSVEPVVCPVGGGVGEWRAGAAAAAAGGEAAVRSVHLLRDRVLDFGELLRAPLPKCPVAPSFTAHWLAVDGAQPRVPQNPQPGSSSSAADGSSSSSAADAGAGADASFKASLKRKRGEHGGEHGAAGNEHGGDGASGGGGGGGVLTKRLVKHVLSRELQAYFSLVEQAVRRGAGAAGGHGAGGRRGGGGAGAEAAEAAEAAEEEEARGVFRSLRRDPALQELAPYLCRFLFAEVARCARARSLGALRPLLRLAECLLLNPHLRVELYLDQVSND